MNLEHTRYDTLLMDTDDRAYARDLARGEFEKVLARWERSTDTA